MVYQVTDKQQQEMHNLRLSFPFRIVYGAYNPTTQEWFASAVLNMRIPNKLAREGWEVFTLEVIK